MTVTVGPTYCDLTIDPSVTKLIFPDEIEDPIRPGSLDHLTQLQTIIWGRNMMGMIEPGVIPDGVLLVLKENYKYPIDASKLGPNVIVCTYAGNSRNGPHDRCFKVWSDDGTIPLPPICKCGRSHSDTRVDRTDIDTEYAYIHTLGFTWMSKTRYDDDESEEDEESESEDSINQGLYDECMNGDWILIMDYIEEHHKSLQLSYNSYALLRKLIKGGKFELCGLLSERLGPIDAHALQTLIEWAPNSRVFWSLLDLVDMLGLKMFETRKQYKRLVKRVCRSKLSLFFAERVYGMWPEPCPYSAFAASCYSWDNEKINYFLKRCDPSAIHTTKATVMMDVINSGNLYAYKHAMAAFDIHWLHIANACIHETDILLFQIIKACAEEKTETMLAELIRHMSEPYQNFTIDQITYCGMLPGFWDQCTDAVVSICKHGHVDAVRFFLGWMGPLKPEQTKLFIEATSSEAVTSTIKPTALISNIALDL